MAQIVTTESGGYAYLTSEEYEKVSAAACCPPLRLGLEGLNGTRYDMDSVADLKALLNVMTIAEIPWTRLVTRGNRG